MGVGLPHGGSREAVVTTAQAMANRPIGWSVAMTGRMCVTADRLLLYSTGGVCSDGLQLLFDALRSVGG